MRIFIKVKPLSKKEKVEKTSQGCFRVEVKEPPVKGAANKAVIECLKKYFNASNVKIVSGLKSRRKTVEIGE